MIKILGVDILSREYVLSTLSVSSVTVHSDDVHSFIHWFYFRKKGPPHDQKHVVTKHDDFPITFSIRFYNSLYYRTSRDNWGP